MVFLGGGDKDMAWEMMLRSCIISRTSGWTTESTFIPCSRGWEDRICFDNMEVGEPESRGRREKMDRLFHVEEYEKSVL